MFKKMIISLMLSLIIIGCGAAILKYGGNIVETNVAWSNAYVYSFAILLIGSLGWMAWESINRRNKIKSIFPLQQPLTMEDIAWIRSDLDRKELNLQKAVESHLIHGANYANEYRDLKVALRFLDETNQKLNSLDWDEELLSRLNEIYLYNSKKYDTKLNIKLIT